jgi:transposase
MYIDEDSIIFSLEPIKESSRCPECGKTAHRVHSVYIRTINDLPVFNYKVRLKVRARRFFCDNITCQRKIFAERLQGLPGRYSRKTTRLAEALLKLSMTTSAEAASKIAKHIANGTSPNTLLRLIRNYKINDYIDLKSVQHIGIDDWAFKKRKSYGTLICDLTTRKPIDMLPDRGAKTLSEWLKLHPQVTLVSRDRSNVYAGAISSTLPHAVQVADR